MDKDKKLSELSNGELKILYFNSNSKVKKDIRTELKCRGKYKLYITKDERIDILNDRINKAIEYIEKVKTLAEVDKVNILSINTLEKILKGE